ncbi:MAG: glycosyltransferase family 2 protein [Agathobaculum desmolans]
MIYGTFSDALRYFTGHISCQPAPAYTEVINLSAKTLGIVIPAFNEEKTLYQNMQKLTHVLSGDRIDHRILLVDDGSSDGTWEVIARLTAESSRFSAIRFARNFGKEVALCAGLRAVSGDYVLIMDSDLQHPPRYIKDMIALLERSGADIVDGVKASRGRENPLYKCCASAFYGLFRRVTGIDLRNSSDFKLLRRPVVNAINALDESHVFFRGLVSWVGFKHETFSFSVDERIGDTSRFSLSRLIRLSLDATLSYTSKPLYFTALAGGIFLLFALILGIQTLYTFFSGSAVSGFTTVILLLLVIGAILCASLGILGAYVARIYDEVKHRPQYIISEQKTHEE